ncbi:unnamed protein product [Paramecium primaurelia]|uniref:Uncharacterized protein n=1 Tax=Paramecium primaurelia TaxID=5886 RepID=A0A8S1PKM2_PARPR|nr:unnamed protein product [Paramecium primaurelia]
MTPKEKVTLKEQIEFLQQQTGLFKQSMELEQELQGDNMIVNLNAIENNLESLKVTIFNREQNVWQYWDQKQKSVSHQNKQVYLLETIFGQKTDQNNSTIMQDLNQIQQIINQMSKDKLKISKQDSLKLYNIFIKSQKSLGKQNYWFELLI